MFMLKKTHRAELQPYLDERGWLNKAVEPLTNLAGGLIDKVEYLAKTYPLMKSEIAGLYREIEGLQSDVRAAESAYEKAAAELAHWKKIKPVRDSGTGRFVRKDTGTSES